METLEEFLEQLKSDPDSLHWEQLAACKGTDVNLYFDLYETNKIIANQIDDLCSSCPVKKQCFQTGVEEKRTGVWGSIYLTQGKIDPIKNNHKDQQKITKLVQELFSDD